MGHAQGLSMLYLEARCVSVVRAAGAQGVQNGSISCVALVLAVPGGTRAILAENVLAAWLDLEVASGNDAIASHSAIRKTAKLMGQFLPGTDFVTSGYSVMPRARQHLRRRQLRRRRHRRVAHDPARLAGRRRDRAGRRGRGAARPRAGRAGGAGGVRRARAAARDGRGGRGGDATATTRATCPTATGRPTSRRPTRSSRGASGARRRARARPPRLRRRRARPSSACCASASRRDYLQTSAVIEPDGLVRSAVNDPNVYLGPGPATGSKASAGSCSRRSRTSSTRAGLGGAVAGRSGRLRGARRACSAGDDPAEVVVAVGPAFADVLRETIAGLAHDEVLAAVVDGVREAGAVPRLVRVRRAADVAFIAHDGARLSGSGVALGLQSKGTAVIHRADLQPLDNLELFGMSPLYTLESYRAMGRNAGGYALGPARRAGADGARQLRAGEAHRPDDAAPCARGASGRAGAPPVELAFVGAEARRRSDASGSCRDQDRCDARCRRLQGSAPPEAGMRPARSSRSAESCFEG